MHYVDFSLLTRMLAVLAGLVCCGAALFLIGRHLLMVFQAWRQGRDPRSGDDDGTDDHHPRPDFYQRIAESAIAGLEEEWRAKQR
jgi:lysophospholipase L1-like esterase